MCSLFLLLALGVSMAPAARAGGPSNLSVSTGFGDEITIKNGLFGNKERVVKDRLGDKFEQKKGIFGNSSTEVNMLGNKYSKKKGIFGTRETEITTILGDRVKTKKGWLFGRRTTTIEAGGVSNLIGSTIKNFVNGDKGVQPVSNPGSLVPDPSNFGAQGGSPDTFSQQTGTLPGADPMPPALDAPPAQSLDQSGIQ